MTLTWTIACKTGVIFMHLGAVFNAILKQDQEFLSSYLSLDPDPSLPCKPIILTHGTSVLAPLLSVSRERWIFSYESLTTLSSLFHSTVICLCAALCVVRWPDDIFVYWWFWMCAWLRRSYQLIFMQKSRWELLWIVAVETEKLGADYGFFWNHQEASKKQ